MISEDTQKELNNMFTNFKKENPTESEYIDEKLKL